MIGVVSARVGHVVQHVVAGEAVSLGHCQEALRSEGPLSIDVETFAYVQKEDTDQDLVFPYPNYLAQKCFNIMVNQVLKRTRLETPKTKLPLLSKALEKSTMSEKMDVN